MYGPPVKKRWIAVVLAAGTLAFWAFRSPSRGGVFEVQVQPGFAGWVVVKQGVAGAPPLPSDRVRWTMRIPPSGGLETSTVLPDHAHETRFFLIEREGSVLVAFKPDPTAVQERRTGKCLLLFVAPGPAPVPPPPDQSCD